MPRLPYNRITAFILGLAVGAGLAGGAGVVAANRSRSRLLGEFERRIADERRIGQTLRGIITESAVITDRLGKVVGGTAEGISGAAGRLRAIAKEVAELENLHSRYRDSELHGGDADRHSD